VSIEVARNIAIVAVIALVVWLAPGGGEGASFVQQLLNAIFIVAMAVVCGILYRQYRGEIFALGDGWRFALYAAVGAAIVTIAASRRLFATGAGAVLWFGVIAAASYTLYLVWQRHRSYT
jgi:surface polysaccharide O-acyltransferase-like enzyme